MPLSLEASSDDNDDETDDSWLDTSDDTDETVLETSDETDETALDNSDEIDETVLETSGVLTLTSPLVLTSTLTSWAIALAATNTAAESSAMIEVLIMINSPGPE